MPPSLLHRVVVPSCVRAERPHGVLYSLRHLATALREQDKPHREQLFSLRDVLGHLHCGVTVRPPAAAEHLRPLELLQGEDELAHIAKCAAQCVETGHVELVGPSCVSCRARRAPVVPEGEQCLRLELVDLRRVEGQVIRARTRSREGRVERCQRLAPAPCLCVRLASCAQRVRRVDRLPVAALARARELATVSLLVRTPEELQRGRRPAPAVEFDLHPAN
mmetsp:Transcript_14834/g.37516  ORF Transcript_14834/g.37516 Transcript_14834/m.37516 type:complete len:221 (+) Transcript_14834:217-879(+)